MRIACLCFMLSAFASSAMAFENPFAKAKSQFEICRGGRGIPPINLNYQFPESREQDKGTCAVHGSLGSMESAFFRKGPEYFHGTSRDGRAQSTLRLSVVVPLLRHMMTGGTLHNEAEVTASLNRCQELATQKSTDSNNEVIFSVRALDKLFAGLNGSIDPTDTMIADHQMIRPLSRFEKAGNSRDHYLLSERNIMLVLQGVMQNLCSSISNAAKPLTREEFRSQFNQLAKKALTTLESEMTEQDKTLQQWMDCAKESFVIHKPNIPSLLELSAYYDNESNKFSCSGGEAEQKDLEDLIFAYLCSDIPLLVDNSLVGIVDMSQDGGRSFQAKKVEGEKNNPLAMHRAVLTKVERVDAKTYLVFRNSHGTASRQHAQTNFYRIPMQEICRIHSIQAIVSDEDEKRLRANVGKEINFTPQPRVTSGSLLSRVTALGKFIAEYPVGNPKHFVFVRNKGAAAEEVKAVSSQINHTEEQRAKE